MPCIANKAATEVAKGTNYGDLGFGYIMCLCYQVLYLLSVAGQNVDQRV